MVSHRQCTICRSNEHSPSGLKQTSTHSLNDYTMREWATRPQRVTQYGFKMLFSSILLVERELACPATIVVTVSNRASALRPVCGKKLSGKNIKSALWDMDVGDADNFRGIVIVHDVRGAEQPSRHPHWSYTRVSQQCTRMERCRLFDIESTPNSGIMNVSMACTPDARKNWIACYTLQSRRGCSWEVEDTQAGY